MTHSLVIDVHTHMLDTQWLELMRAHGAPHIEVVPNANGPDTIRVDGMPFLAPARAHYDYDLRLKAMDQAGVDVAIVSLTCPNVYWGSEAASAEAARVSNSHMAEMALQHKGRIRWLASLPWQHPARAEEELQRSVQAGAVGVIVLANVDGAALTEERFAPIWRKIDELSLPVLLHPTIPPGASAMALQDFGLLASTGFMIDTTLAVSRMMFDGFFERYNRLKLIVSHAGGTLPYIIGRLDECFDKVPACRTKTAVRPGEWLRHMYFDSLAYSPEALRYCVDVVGSDRVMYGSDFPHNIGDMTGSLARIDELPATLHKKLKSATAMKLFNL